MHAITIVQDVLRKGCPHIHSTRLNALLLATRGALHASSHTLSNLARAMDSPVAVRYRVKRMDRLLGSVTMNQECAAVYAAMAGYWLRDGNNTPLIVVDWTDLNKSRSAQMIRASVVVGGRSLTLFEEVHSIKAATSPQVHRAFLEHLKAMLAPGCRPIVITDAGFRSPWFRAVEAQGWHWVGRIRGRTLVRSQSTKDSTWIGCKTLYPQATTTAQDLGLFDCVQNRPHAQRLVIIKKAPKGRHKLTLKGTQYQTKHSQKQARGQAEPWLLAASLSLEHLSAQAIVAIYAQRMQIEQAFRDTKNARLGLGLSESASRTPQRLAVLALIASLAEFVLRLIGQCAMNQNLQYDLQLTNRKTRPEISVIRVGKLIHDSALHAFSAKEFKQTLQAWAAPHFALQI